MEEIKQSPRPMLVGLDFPMALKAIIDGKTATKMEWANKEIYGVLKDGFLMLHKADGKFYQWLLSEADLMGHDWRIIELPTELPIDVIN